MRALLLSALLIALPAAAKTIVLNTANAQCNSPANCTHGLRFASGDWLLVCSNAGNCAAVGYHPGSSNQTEHRPVSVLIRRKAGANSPANTLLALDPPVRENLLLNGRPLQAGALLPLLRENPAQTIVYRHGSQQWTLSTLGAAEVLAKMDAYQGRSGTPGALLNPGRAAYQGAATSKPVITARLPNPEPPRTSESESLRTLLRGPAAASDLAPNGCQRLEHGNHPDQEVPLFTLHPLDKDTVLAETACDYGNANRLFALVSSDLSRLVGFVPVPNTAIARYSNGVIEARQADGAFGECYQQSQYVWDGSRFVLNGLSTSGLCGKGRMSGVWGGLPLFETATQIDLPYQPDR